MHRDGNTALHLAAMNGHLRSLNILIRVGADVNAVNRSITNMIYSDKRTALHLAAMNNHSNIMTSLLFVPNRVNQNIPAFQGASNLYSNRNVYRNTNTAAQNTQLIPGTNVDIRDR